MNRIVQIANSLLFLLLISCASKSSLVAARVQKLHGMSEHGGSVYSVRTVISDVYIGGKDFVGRRIEIEASPSLDKLYLESAWTGDEGSFSGVERSILFVPEPNLGDPFTIGILSSSLECVSIHRCRIDGHLIFYTDMFYIQGLNSKLRAFVYNLLNEGANRSGCANRDDK